MLFFYIKALLISSLYFILRVDNYSEIIPNIYIGNIYSALYNYDNFDVIVNCSKNLPFTQKNNNIKVRIPIDDKYIFKCDELLNYLDVIDTIKEYYKNNKKILIHCQFGIQRSSTLTTLFLMKELGIDKDKAINLVKSQRNISFFPFNNFNHVFDKI